jgi:hypothetical protein
MAELGLLEAIVEDARELERTEVDDVALHPQRVRALANGRHRVYTDAAANLGVPRMKTQIAMVTLLGLLGAANCDASFHRMQIEQAMGGVDGDVTQQAVQLRMRSGGQNLMGGSRLRVVDATGANPVMLIDFGSSVTNAALGDRILVVSQTFAALQDPVADFVMTSNIPPAYAAGGRLLFESDGGEILFSLCWGSYSGPTTGSTENDSDGQFAPCVAGPLPTADLRALRFAGAANATSTTNAADFALTAGAAEFTNNARTSATVIAPPIANRGRDCNDTDPNIYPTQIELVGNAKDDDCDGLGDENALGDPSDDTSDADGDGITLNAGDCDDTATTVGPNAAEIIGDLRDNDCDPRADEDALDVSSLDGVDHDGDGFAMFDRVFASGFEP